MDASRQRTYSAAPRLPFWRSRDWVLGLLLILAVVATYQPVWHAGFIWDDEALVTANPSMEGTLGLKEIWTTRAADICPLTITTFWVEHALWGLNPMPYHLVNVFMQGACAVVLWRVLRNLKIPGAWLGAALWALHPVQVESVAWISEMKNTQSGLFYLLTIFFLVKGLMAREDGHPSNQIWNYSLTLVFAAFAMASKSSTVILPVVLCLCAWWVEGRWQWRNLGRVGPIFLMSLAAAVVTIWRQYLEGVNDPHWARSWPERLATSGDVVWFYLGKLLWPYPLSAIYPRWQIDARSWFSYVPVMAVLLLLVILWHKRHAWARPYFFALAYFLVALLPILGLVEHYFLRFSFVADHLQYLAAMGILALAGAGLTRLADLILPGRLWVQSTLGAGLLLSLGLLSWNRAWAYENETTLWTDTLAKNPNCGVAYSDLGNVLFKEGKWDEARTLFQKAVEIDPTYVDARYNLGNAFFQRGQWNEAVEQFQKVVEMDPHYARAHNNLGIIFVQKGQMEEAVAQYQQASEMDPNYAEPHNNLGTVLLQRGQIDEAVAQFQKALKINPRDVVAYNDLGEAFLKKGELDSAIICFQKAFEIDPGCAAAHYNLGNIFAQKGQWDEAVTQYQQALETNPNYVEAHNNLGIALLQKGRLNEAIAQFQEVVRLKPDYRDGQNNLAKAKALAAQKPVRN